MSSCGTHLILDLFEDLGVARLHDQVLLLQAMFLSRASPSAPCRMHNFENQSAWETLTELSDGLGVELPDNLENDHACFDCFKSSVELVGERRFVIGHVYALAHSRKLKTEDGEELIWTVEDRDNFQAFLERAVEHCGYDLRQFAVVRHPVDNFLSQTERKAGRSFDKQQMKNEITEFYMLVARLRTDSTIPVVRYEDLCGAPDHELPSILEKFHLSREEIDRLNTNIIHSGSRKKWVLYPTEQVQSITESFELPEWFGYDVTPKTGFAGARTRLKIYCNKYRSEVAAINQILNGDFSADAAFSRHHRSLPAKVWFRLRIMFPGARRNLRLFYETKKPGEDPSIPSLYESIWRYLRLRANS